MNKKQKAATVFVYLTTYLAGVFVSQYMAEKVAKSYIKREGNS